MLLLNLTINQPTNEGLFFQHLLSIYPFLKTNWLPNKIVQHTRSFRETAASRTRVSGIVLVTNSSYDSLMITKTNTDQVQLMSGY